MVSSTPRPHFTPGKDPVPISQEADWARAVWTGGICRPIIIFTDRKISGRNAGVHTLLTPRNIIIFENVTIPPLVDKRFAPYGTRRSINVFTRTGHLKLL